MQLTYICKNIPEKFKLNPFRWFSIKREQQVEGNAQKHRFYTCKILLGYDILEVLCNKELFNICSKIIKIIKL